MTPPVRAMTDSERLALAELGRDPAHASYCLYLGLGGWGASVMLAIALASNYSTLDFPWFPWFFHLSPILWIAIALAARQTYFRGFTPFGELCQQDLAEGIVQTLPFSATDAIKVKNVDEEMCQYFLRLADDSILFLRGRYLYESVKQKEFPCTEFEIVQAPLSKVVFHVTCDGTYLPPSREFNAFSAEQFEKGDLPQNMEVLKISWNEIEEKYS